MASSEEQKRQVAELLKNERIKVGQTWYLIPSKWYKQWKDFVRLPDFTEQDDEDNEPKENVERPEAIDNSVLISQQKNKDNNNNSTTAPAGAPSSAKNGSISSSLIKLNPGLQEGEDYQLVSEPVWNLLSKWYGGGPPIPRKTIEEGIQKKARVEVYPLLLQVSQAKPNGLADPSLEIEVMVSKKATVKEFKELVCQEMQLDPAKARVWNMFGGSNNKRLEDENETLEDSTIVDGQKMMLEVQNADGTWPRSDAPKVGSSSKKDEKGSPKADKNKGKRSFLNFFGFGRGNNSGDEARDGSSNGGDRSGNSSGEEAVGSYPRGLCGFNNLGNTCFMNSALQCLSNTAPLTEYFLSGKYKSEINRNNPLGMKGKIAEEYGALMKQTWNGQNTSVAPRNFKLTIGKFAPQFSGYSQHDSQELLGFLLDGLHEDLNRVVKKPYVEAKEAEGRPDHEVAAESWKYHLMRNQSIIVDLFQGQLKSTLVCPKCEHISKTWDPFMYLSLPLPIERDRTIEVILVKYTEYWTTPVKYAIKIDKNAKVGDLKKALAQKAEMHYDRLLLADVYNNRVYAFLNESKAVSGIRGNDITVAYEIPPGVDVTSDDFMRVQVVNRRDKKSGSSLGGYGSPYELFGMPFLFFFVKDKTPMKQIYHAMWKRTRVYVKDYELPSPSSENGKKESKKGKTNNKEGMEVEEPTVQENGHVEEQLSDTNIYPFTITVVSTTGSSCGKCSSVSCNGCELKYPDKVIALKNSGHTVSLDWDSKVLKKFFDKDAVETILVHNSVEESKQVKKSAITLEHCLNLFTTDERLGANDPWYCPKCKDFQQAMKKFDLWKLPQVLVVHLKRFSYSKYSRDKLNTLVEFPLEGLDLSQYVKDVNEPSNDPPIYDLFAVSNHSGGLGGGHYTAYAKNRFDGKWYCFNDSSCSPASESHIVSPAAYVLVYQRRGSHNFKLTSQPSNGDHSSSDEGGNNHKNKEMELEDSADVSDEEEI